MGKQFSYDRKHFSPEVLVKTTIDYFDTRIGQFQNTFSVIRTEKLGLVKSNQMDTRSLLADNIQDCLGLIAGGGVGRMTGTTSGLNRHVLTAKINVGIKGQGVHSKCFSFIDDLNKFGGLARLHGTNVTDYFRVLTWHF